MSLPTERTEWRDVPGFAGFYQVSNYGDVRSLDRQTRNGRYSFIRKGRNLTPRIDAHGYYVVTLMVVKNFIKPIHRMVAMAFIDNPNNFPMINHINGIKTDNRLCNLEWCTAQMNVAHSRLIGLNTTVGENCHLSKLTEKEVKEIRELYRTKQMTTRELSNMYGVSPSNLLLIKNRKTWKDI